MQFGTHPGLLGPSEKYGYIWVHCTILMHEHRSLSKCSQDNCPQQDNLFILIRKLSWYLVNAIKKLSIIYLNLELPVFSSCAPL